MLITHSIPSNAMEGWVKKVAELSGQPVDWHFFGGRAVVKALGDLHKVYEAMEKLRPEHDALYRAALSSSVFADDPLPGIYVEMSMPKAYNPQDGYRYQILCLVPQYERAWEHCDYAADRTEKNYLIGEYRLAYGPSYRFKSILLPQKYWPKKEKAIA